MISTQLNFASLFKQDCNYGNVSIRYYDDKLRHLKTRLEIAKQEMSGLRQVHIFGYIYIFGYCVNCIQKQELCEFTIKSVESTRLPNYECNFVIFGGSLEGGRVWPRF